MTRTRSLLAAALVLVAWRASAHDYWLLPDPLRASRGDRVALTLWVGDDFVPEEERPWQRGRTLRFAHVTARASEDWLARPTEGARPVLGDVRLGVGGHLVVMDRDAARIELPAERFERYLRDEGLDAVVAARRARGESERPGRERYTRYLKAFVAVGAATDGVSTRAVGQTFELIPREDLARVRPGGALHVSLRFRGAPAAGVSVEALSRVGDDVRRARAVTDARGAATFAVDREGTWLLRATHMIRCEGCADADWESFWTSYVFGVCAAGATRCAAAPMRVPAARDAGRD